jgi:hypothetical protein
LVLGHGADGDADPFGEFVGGHGADDDALLHHGFEDGVAVTDFDEDEVGVAGDVFEAHGGELVLEVDAAFVGDGFGFGLVIFVEEAGEGGGLGEGVGVEGLASALEDLDEFGRAEAVTDAEAGEALDFREGAEDDDEAITILPLGPGYVTKVWLSCNTHEDFVIDPVIHQFVIDHIEAHT